MSRGPGRIERAIEEAFTANPSQTFTVDELVAIAYPGTDEIEKKHRVAVVRAADKVAARRCWEKALSERFNHPLVYFNKLDVRSYAIMRLRTDFLHNDESPAEVEAQVDNPEGREAEAMSEGGSWWLHVEVWRAERAGQHERAKALQDEVDKRVEALWAGFR
jgi:hypothetical protein